MLWIKSLHIVFVTAWFAGLFYMPRILVNLAMETDATSRTRLLTMARKLYRFMTMLAVPALGFGLSAFVLLAVASYVLATGRRDALALAEFSEKLPDGLYRLGEVPDFCGGAHAALAWLLGLYQFSRYKKPARRSLKLVLPDGVDGEDGHTLRQLAVQAFFQPGERNSGTRGATMLAVKKNIPVVCFWGTEQVTWEQAQERLIS